MDRCRATVDEVTCRNTGAHAEHFGKRDGEGVVWPNDDFRPPASMIDLRELARTIPREPRRAQSPVSGDPGSTRFTVQAMWVLSRLLLATDGLTNGEIAALADASAPGRLWVTNQVSTRLTELWVVGAAVPQRRRGSCLGACSLVDPTHPTSECSEHGPVVTRPNPIGGRPAAVWIATPASLGLNPDQSMNESP